MNTFANFLKGFAGDAHFSTANVELLARDTSVEITLKIINQFRITLETSVQKLAASLLENSIDEMVRVCHKIAGSAELVGFEKLGRDCRAVMNGAKTGENIIPIVHKVKEQAEELVRELEATCPELKSFV